MMNYVLSVIYKEQYKLSREERHHDESASESF